MFCCFCPLTRNPTKPLSSLCVCHCLSLVALCRFRPRLMYVFFIRLSLSSSRLFFPSGVVAAALCLCLLSLSISFTLSLFLFPYSCLFCLSFSLCVSLSPCLSLLSLPDVGDVGCGSDLSRGLGYLSDADLFTSRLFDSSRVSARGSGNGKVTGR